MLFLMFAAGASVGAENRYPEDPRVVANFNEALGESEAIVDEALSESDLGVMEYVTRPLVVAFFDTAVWAVTHGFWFGLGNPYWGQQMWWMAMTFYLGVVGVYLYLGYKTLKEVLSWL